MTERRGRARQWGDRVLATGAVLGTVCLLAALAGAVLGLGVLVVRSGSMGPTIDTGALAFTHRVDASDVRPGDVVAVEAGGDRVMHRVVSVAPAGRTATLVLRGDENDATDPTPYRVERADRVWFSMPFVGRAVAWLGSPVGLLGLAVYVVCLLRIVVRPDAAPVRRHRARDRALRMLLGAALVGAVVVGRAQPGWAAWTDQATVSGPVLGTLTVPAPSTFTCGALGLGSVVFDWSAVPGATGYRLHYGTSGGSVLTLSTTTTNLTIAVSGGTAWVEAYVDYGSTTWTSTASPTRAYSVAVGALSTCT